MIDHIVNETAKIAEKLEAENKELREAVWAYLSEFDNPVPDAMYRKTLRDKLRALVGAPPQRLRKSG